VVTLGWRLQGTVTQAVFVSASTKLKLYEPPPPWASVPRIRRVGAEFAIEDGGHGAGGNPTGRRSGALRLLPIGMRRRNRHRTSRSINASVG